MVVIFLAMVIWMDIVKTEIVNTLNESQIVVLFPRFPVIVKSDVDSQTVLMEAIPSPVNIRISIPIRRSEAACDLTSGVRVVGPVSVAGADQPKNFVQNRLGRYYDRPNFILPNYVEFILLPKRFAIISYSIKYSLSSINPKRNITLCYTLGCVRLTIKLLYIYFMMYVINFNLPQLFNPTLQIRQ